MKFLFCFGLIYLAMCICVPTMAQQAALEFFALDKVSLKDSPFKNALEVNTKYLLELDADRLLAPFMKEAGLPWSADNYGNWENTGLDGHIGGHYLSALALTYAASSNPLIEERLDYMLDQLSLAQAHNGDGYLSGVPNGKQIWAEINQGIIKPTNFSLNDRWVPLYNIHKVLAGLRDAYLIAGKAQALSMLIALTNWFESLTSSLTDEQFQQLLISEHGGLNEVFADLAAITKEPRYLSLAKKMSHRAILDPLLASTDKLTGLHANTQIPKVIGFQRVAQLTATKDWNEASDYFWKEVVERRSVSIGGNSVREHFHPVNNFSSMISSEEGPETCNSYNMLRLSEKLFQSSPESKFMDYYERTIFNHILSSQHPEKGGYVYFTSMRPNHYRVYSQTHENFWCCVGSGMENHAKYGQVIYAHAGSQLFVNLFIASQLDWAEKGIQLVQETNFPYEESTTIRFLQSQKVEADLKFRHPSWLTKGTMEIHVNGKKVETRLDGKGYVVLQGKWSKKDIISIQLPMQVKQEFLPDGSNWTSFLYGPIVLAANTGQEGLKGLFADDSRMGHVASGPMIPLEYSPILNADKSALPLKKTELLQFSLPAEVFYHREEAVELVPFFSIHESRYQVYWPQVKADAYVEFLQELQSQDEYVRKLESITVDKIAIGEQQPESEHGFAGELTEMGQEDGKFWRRTRAQFAYTLTNPANSAKKMRLMFFKPGMDESFTLLINGLPVQQIPEQWEMGQLLVQEYLLEAEDTLHVTIQSKAGQLTPKIHHIRLLN